MKPDEHEFDRLKAQKDAITEERDHSRRFWTEVHPHLMNNELTTPQGGENGLTVEHILLSITIVSDKTSAGQFDDSCSFQLQRKMLEYNGIKSVEARVLYKHTKIEHHTDGCECHYCKPPLT